MARFPRAFRHLAFLLPFAFLAVPSQAQVQVEQPQRAESLQVDGETPWIYEGSDIPRDEEWLFGEMDNGLRYAVRRNGVPPRQVSIRIRIDAGSLHERDFEQGYAHLLEHMVFRQSKYLGDGEAIPTWQRLGATFGSDTNAETSPTHTVYKLDLPNVTKASLEESFRLLSGMMREPTLSSANLAADVPIVLAEKRERGGAGERVAIQSRQVFFEGQRLANRLPIGTEETLLAATQESVREFHRRWYRPENTVISVAGDIDPNHLALLIEEWFGDWEGRGEHVPAPDFGDPLPPPGTDPANPVGQTAVIVEPNLPRSLSYVVMRPWRQVQDTIEYNQNKMVGYVAQAIINRRLESRARAGGSFLYAQVSQDDISRSTDATFVSIGPLTEDWQAALADVRGVIADALAEPPTQEEIDREVAEIDVVYASLVQERAVMAGSKLADDIVLAVDIRETVASPEVVLDVFRGARPKFTPANLLNATRELFTGDVIRSVYLTPDGSEASAGAIRTALLQNVAADSSARLASNDISFDKLPPLGEPGVVVAEGPLGLFDIERVDLSNGVKAILWSNEAEPGRVIVKVRFGAGYRAFDEASAPYAALGRAALVGSGVGELGQEELDRISTGRKMGFDFAIEDAVFSFTAQTREEDLADQLYLFAAKLGDPRWDVNPVERVKAGSRLSYESFAASPAGLLNRDLEYLLTDQDPRFFTPDPPMIEGLSAAQFRSVWEPLLKQGPVEVMIFGDFDRNETVAALTRTFGALPTREPISPAVAARTPAFPSAANGTTVLRHGGDPDQAAAVIAWPAGAGIANVREYRQLELLMRLFDNRLLDEMRERSGASYAPRTVLDWPVDLQSGGNITAIAQLKPEDVPTFFAAADAIAADLAANPPSQDEFDRAIIPLRQLIERASTGNTFWLYQLEGSTTDPRRIQAARSILRDYLSATPQTMQALASRYLDSRPGWQLAVIPEGQALAEQAPVRQVVNGR